MSPKQMPETFRLKLGCQKMTTGTSITRCRCKHFCTMHKATRRSLKRTNVELNYKDMSIREGSFGVQKVSVGRLPEKDTSDKDIIAKCLCIMGDNFSNKRRRNRQRFIRLSKATSKLPPFEHDVTITRRANGKYILHIPCDPKYTRCDQSGRKNAMCGIDPGGRTFCHRLRPTNCGA